MNKPCPCGSTINYTSCCQLFHSGERKPDTAEQLMRSRYCAFVQGSNGLGGMSEYLVNTHHVSTRHTNQQQEIQQSFKQQQWLGLTIINTFKGQPQDTHGQVEFVAFFQSLHTGQTAGQLHECSSFTKENNQWFYVNGEIKPEIKLKRNEPCWCASNKKFKHCHGK